MMTGDPDGDGHDMRPHGSRHAQSSMEYLFITGLAFMMLLLIVVAAYSQSSSYANDVTAAQLQKVGNSIVDAANAVSYAGPPSRRTLTLYFPDGIRGIAFQGQSLVFSASGTGGVYQYAVSATTNMTGSLQPFPGLHNVVVTAQEAIVNVSDG